MPVFPAAELGRDESHLYWLRYFLGCTFDRRRKMHPVLEGELCLQRALKVPTPPLFWKSYGCNVHFCGLKRFKHLHMEVTAGGNTSFS